MGDRADESLIDRLYEAAFLPELWPAVLHDLSGIADSAGGVLFAQGPRYIARWTASPGDYAMTAAFAGDLDAPLNERPARLARTNYFGFLRDVDFLPESHLTARDPIQAFLRSHGLGWQMGTMITLPVGEIVVCSFDRSIAKGPHPAELCGRLDAIRPHLARAAMIAARLGLERARAAVATLEALGLPAAVLTASGRVLAVNRLIDEAPEILSGARERLHLAHLPADRLLRETLERPGLAARSIAVPGSETSPPGIVHVLPLPGAAHDILGGSTLVVLTTVAANTNIPDPTILPALFDLTPKEARLASALAAGRSLKEAAHNEGVQFSTARSYLDQIFRKTGTNQQSQLVALLKGTRLSPPC